MVTLDNKSDGSPHGCSLDGEHRPGHLRSGLHAPNDQHLLVYGRARDDITLGRRSIAY